MAVTTVSTRSTQPAISRAGSAVVPWYRHLAWVAGAAMVGFSVPAIFVTGLQWPRAWFVLPYALVSLAYIALYVRWAGIDLLARVRQHWRLGIVGAAAVSVFVVANVLAQPASPTPAGLELIGALVWLGVVYGTADSLLLSVLPLIATWQALSSLGWTQGWPGRIASGVLAMAASLAVAAAYHLGFPEYHGAGLLAPIIGNGLLSLASLLTMSPVAAVLGHIAMHVAAVLHGINTAVQLPPHY